MRFALLPIAIMLSLLLFACGGDDEEDAAPVPTAAETSTPAATTATAAPEFTPTATPEVSLPVVDPINAENFAGLEAIYKLHVEAPQFIAWQLDGKLLVASRDETVLIDPASGASMTVYNGAGQEPVVAVSANGRIATAAAGNTGIDIRDFSGAITSHIDTNGQFGAADFSDDGTLLAASRLDRIAVGLWEAATGAPAAEVDGFETAAPVYSAVLGPDETLIWVSRAAVQVSELSTGGLRPRLEHEDFVSSVAMNHDATILAAAAGQTATLWDVATGQRLHDLAQPAPALAVEFLPDSALLLVGADDGVVLWDATTYEDLATLEAPARQLAIALDGRQLATIDQEGLVTIWTPNGP